MSRTFRVENRTQAEALRYELTKLRCWMTGYKAGVGKSQTALSEHIPGEHALRLAIIAIDEGLRDLEPKASEDEDVDSDVADGG